MIYALVITRLPVQYDRYSLRFSYFTDMTAKYEKKKKY